MKKYIVFCIAFLASFALQAKKEVITKDFNSQNIEVVKVVSKFGQIKVENWAKNQILVTATIKVASSKEETAEKILSNVSVNMQPQFGMLNVETTFERFFSFMKFTNNLFRNGDFSIDYDIKMPKNIILDIALENGDIILFERNADVRIDHSNGRISAQSINGKAKIKLRSSNLKLDGADSLFLDTRNSNLLLAKSNYIKTESYNTNYEVGEIGTFEIKSLRDNFKVAELTNVFATSSLSSFTLGSLRNLGIIETNYGNFSLAQIETQFDEIKITSKGTEVVLSLNGTPANIAINHHQSTKLEIPDKFGLSMKFGENQKYFITTGTVENPKGNNQLLINIKGGKLQLR